MSPRPGHTLKTVKRTLNQRGPKRCKFVNIALLKKLLNGFWVVLILETFSNFMKIFCGSLQ